MATTSFHIISSRAEREAPGTARLCNLRDAHVKVLHNLGNGRGSALRTAGEFDEIPKLFL